MTKRERTNGRVASRDDRPRPALSLVVAAQPPVELGLRALASLAPDYQRGVDAEYELVIVDNGSDCPAAWSELAEREQHVRLCRLDRHASHADAVWTGVTAAHGQSVGVVDGAAVASPGLVRTMIGATRAHPDSAIVTFNWELGYDIPPFATESGWTPSDEACLLASIDWPADGYRLFEVATLDIPAADSWFSAIVESRAFALPAAVWSRLADLHEAKGDASAGTTSSLLASAAALDDVAWVLLISEATFRQVGAPTRPRTPPGGVPPVSDPVVLGTPPVPIPPEVVHALDALFPDASAGEATDADRAAPDPLTSEWLRLAHGMAYEGRTAESVAFSRRARQAAPASQGWRPLLRTINRADTIDSLPADRQARFYALAGDALQRTGTPDAAGADFERALTVDPLNGPAYSGISQIRMPGPPYDEVLRRVHEVLVPPTYLEIGVFEGASLRLAQPPTVAVAIDPAPAIRHPITVEYHLYPERSDEFFANHDVRSLLGGGPSLAFIDGLHQFPVVLDDFRHVEAIADPETIIVLHDVIPFDEITQRPERACDFYTGDVWKLLHCLATVRSDLRWFTVPTAPSGLAFVSGLDPSSKVLWDAYDELVGRFGALTFEDSRQVPDPVVENRWPAIEAELRRIRPEAHRPAGPPSLTAEPASAEAIARRVRALESELRRREASERELRTDLERVQAAAAADAVHHEADLDAARARLEAFEHSRVLRMTRPLRDLYGRVHERTSPSSEGR